MSCGVLLLGPCDCSTNILTVCNCYLYTHMYMSCGVLLLGPCDCSTNILAVCSYYLYTHMYMYCGVLLLGPHVDGGTSHGHCIDAKYMLRDQCSAVGSAHSTVSRHVWHHLGGMCVYTCVWVCTCVCMCTCVCECVCLRISMCVCPSIKARLSCSASVELELLVM